MREEVRIEPEGVRGAAPRFTAAAADLAQALTQLQAGLSALGSFWGDDEQGARFAAFHEPDKQAVLTMLGQVRAGLESIAPALEATADGYEAVDRRVAGRLSSYVPPP